MPHITARSSLLLHLLSSLSLPFDSTLNFKSHFRTVPLLPIITSIFSSTYGPSTSTLIHLYKSYIHSLFDYGAPAASPNVALVGDNTNTFHFKSTFHSIISSTMTGNNSTFTFHRNLYLDKYLYRHTMQQLWGTGLH